MTGSRVLRSVRTLQCTKIGSQTQSCGKSKPEAQNDAENDRELLEGHQ
jgi:hypothetical protein